MATLLTVALGEDVVGFSSYSSGKQLRVIDECEYLVNDSLGTSYEWGAATNYEDLTPPLYRIVKMYCQYNVCVDGLGSNSTTTEINDGYNSIKTGTSSSMNADKSCDLILENFNELLREEAEVDDVYGSFTDITYKDLQGIQGSEPFTY